MKRYAVNLASKHHRPLKDGEQPLPNEKLVMANAEGWVEVSPNEVIAPITGSFEARRRDNVIIQGSINIRWGWIGTDQDIFAYRPIIKEQKTWDGKGLPPVGAECEVTANGYGGQWFKIRITAVTNDHVIGYIREDRESALLYKSNGVEFRPLPSPRDQWVEQALDLVTPIPGPQMLAQAIYDAMLSGDLPVPGTEQ